MSLKGAMYHPCALVRVLTVLMTLLDSDRQVVMPLVGSLPCV
jgi:hypothetical protein